MATKTTTKTGNPRQQKQLIFVAIGGVALLALAFFQGPKVWKQINPPPAKPQASASAAAPGTTAGAVTAPVATLKSTAVVVKPAPRPGATTVVAGVDVKPWQVPQATTGQLWTFSRLRAKDPFVQQIDQDASITPVAAFSNAPAGSATTATTSSTSSPARSTKAAAAVNAPTQLPPTNATIEVNGNDVPLKLDQRFPPSTKVFRLAALKPRSAQIVLAGGGKLGPTGKVTLTMGKPLTLVNGTTGKRYTLRLLYTGSEPEVVQKFSTKAK